MRYSGRKNSRSSRSSESGNDRSGETFLILPPLPRRSSRTGSSSRDRGGRSGRRGPPRPAHGALARTSPGVPPRCPLPCTRGRTTRRRRRPYSGGASGWRGQPASRGSGSATSWRASRWVRGTRTPLRRSRGGRPWRRGTAAGSAGFGVPSVLDSRQALRRDLGVWAEGSLDGRRSRLRYGQEHEPVARGQQHRLPNQRSGRAHGWRRQQSPERPANAAHVLDHTRPAASLMCMPFRV